MMDIPRRIEVPLSLEQMLFGDYILLHMPYRSARYLNETSIIGSVLDQICHNAFVSVVTS